MVLSPCPTFWLICVDAPMAAMAPRPSQTTDILNASTLLTFYLLSFRRHKLRHRRPTLTAAAAAAAAAAAMTTKHSLPFRNYR